MPQQIESISKNFVLTPRQILKRSALTCLLIASILFGLALKKIEPLPLSGAPLMFDGANAHAQMAKLAKDFPGRMTWTDQRKKAALWLKSELQKLGYSPRGMLFSETIAGKQYTDLENVFAEKRGTTHPDEIIVVTGHYDIADTTNEGAMDDASGVAIVLELARVLATEQTRRSVVFLLTDSEEYGAFWGARAFAQGFERADKIVAVASFDFVASEKQVSIVTLASGLKQGYTPLWLRELAVDSVRSLGTVEAVDFAHVVEFIERSIQIPPADHGPFLSAGIPAFNYVGQNENFPRQMAHYHHTQNDVADAMQVQSFIDYGRAAERLVRSVDELHHIPEDFRNSSYWKVSARYYLEGWTVTLLHILAFVPFLLYSVAKFGVVLRNVPRERATVVFAVFANEAKGIGIVLGSLLLGYSLVLMLPALKVIDQYEAFPATQKSTLLYNPNFLAILLVIASVAAIYWIFKRTFEEPVDHEHHGDLRHTVHAALLAFIIFLAFLKNSYLATLLLLPPAYFWTAMSHERRVESRWMNMLLLIGGSITFVIITIVMTTIFHVGVVYWYLFLSAAYGLISAYSVVLFFMAITSMIRLFRSLVW
jgi:hypothetical protein